MPRPEVSLVIPIYNEEEVLPRLDERLALLLDKLGVDCEVVFVDDGSKDRSLEILRAMIAREPRYRAVSFARNFGHQRAITCGMDATRGKSVVVMDADLQDPPEVILDMLAKWREGYDVVYGRRRSREGETWFKLFSAKIFYRLFAAMIPIEVPLDTGDFRLMSRRVVVAMRELRETHRFVRGLVAWVGFKQTAVEYDRAARAAGETKYPFRKMIAFAFDGIASFSILPLRLATYMGVLVGAASVLYAISAVIAHFGFNATVPGWTTTVVLMSALSSVQLIVIGVLGEYVGRIYEEVKGRPLYVVGERLRHRKMRPRAETQDFGSIGEVIRKTDRPPPSFPAAPPPSLPPSPAPSLAAAPPASLPPSSGSPGAPRPSSPPPPPASLAPSSGSPGAPRPSSPPASLPPSSGAVPRPSSSPVSKPPPPLPAAAKNRDKL
jgi:polyisoprenyl-phosphate glycosyltransferase